MGFFVTISLSMKLFQMKQYENSKRMPPKSNLAGLLEIITRVKVYSVLNVSGTVQNTLHVLFYMILVVTL